ENPANAGTISPLKHETLGFLKGFRGFFYLGWVTGFEPATSGATVRRSATELHPPFRATRHYKVRQVRGGQSVQRCLSHSSTHRARLARIAPVALLPPIAPQSELVP